MSVDGVQRIVCGVTEMTTCQEIVIALAQALGKFMSCMTKGKLVGVIAGLHCARVNFTIYQEDGMLRYTHTQSL